jgi:3-oxoadipate enol-lactonase
MTFPAEHRYVRGAAGDISLHLQGPLQGTPVLMAHSILSSSMMWDAQALLLAERGFRVIRADTRGHGQSQAPAAPYTMRDLVNDSVAVLDGLGIDSAHYIGLSLGGMSGFGLGIEHAQRLKSLCLCDARADMPPAFATPWDERIVIAKSQGCAALAQATTERWFGRPFLDANPDVERQFSTAIAQTTVAGFEGCARAIQGLDYLTQVQSIRTRTTLIVGANDGPLPQAMQALSQMIKDANIEIIDGAGHLPNIDQAHAFNAALLRHFAPYL